VKIEADGKKKKNHAEFRKLPDWLHIEHRNGRIKSKQYPEKKIANT